MCSNTFKHTFMWLGTAKSSDYLKKKKKEEQDTFRFQLFYIKTVNKLQNVLENKNTFV